MIPFRTLAPLALCVFLPYAGFAASRTHGAAQNKIELPRVEYSEGDVVHSTWNSHAALHTIVLADGKVTSEFDSVEDKTGTKSVRVLATDERGLARVRVAYGALKATQRVTTAQDGSGGTAPDEVAERNPLQGNTFVIERGARGFRVLDESGTRVAEGLAQLVLDEEGVDGDEYVLAGDRLARELAGKPLTVGVDIALSDAAGRAFVGDRDGAGDVRFVVTPRETRVVDGARVNVFGALYTIHHTGAGGEPDTTVELKGEVRFEASTGRFLAFELEGALSLQSSAASEGRTYEVLGEGPWTIRASARYTR